MHDGFSLEENNDGSINILNENGDVHTYIAKPWAKDANGNDIPTHYEIKKQKDEIILRQYIEFDKNSVFPITADPSLCSQAVSSVQWINRNGIWSVSESPTWCGTLVQHWTELYNKIPYNSYWNKSIWSYNTYWSVYDQWLCHWNIAGPFKTPWNLEPSRPNVGYWPTVWANCNP